MPIYDLEQFRQSIADRRVKITKPSGGKFRMDDFTVDEFAADEPAPKKRRYTRKPGQNGFKATAAQTAKRSAVALSEAQFRKLFKLLTGGELAVTVTDEAIEFHVPQDAIQMVLPALLEKL